MEISKEQQERIRKYFQHRFIPRGPGNEQNACSLGGINFALYGHLIYNSPDCMSEGIGIWIIRVQDCMPDAMRNSNRWRELLPLAAGTGRKHEEERAQIIINWMWETVLPYYQPIADENGYGKAWNDMCNLKTEESANYAVDRTEVLEVLDKYAALAAGCVGDLTAIENVKVNSVLATGCLASEQVYWATAAAACVADAVVDNKGSDAGARAWEHFDPCGLLERLIEISEEEGSL